MIQEYNNGNCITLHVYIKYTYAYENLRYQPENKKILHCFHSEIKQQKK